jgi:ribonuclease R
MYQKLTEKIAGKPEERILSFLMLRSLKQARYSEENLGHFALAATSYTHFTSPIRRYPDLIVHRILKDVLRDTAELWEGDVPIGRYVGQTGSVKRPGGTVSREPTPATPANLRPGRSAVTMALITNQSSPPADRSRWTNCTISRKNPVSQSDALTKLSAN